MLRSGRQRYVTQRNLNKARPLLQFQKIKTHFPTACEFYDLNMGFVVWTRLLAHLSIASNSYVHRILCKNTHSNNFLDINVTAKRYFFNGRFVKKKKKRTFFFVSFDIQHLELERGQGDRQDIVAEWNFMSSQQIYNVATTSLQRRCNVVTANVVYCGRKQSTESVDGAVAWHSIGF